MGFSIFILFIIFLDVFSSNSFFTTEIRTNKPIISDIVLENNNYFILATDLCDIAEYQLLEITTKENECSIFHNLHISLLDTSDKNFTIEKMEYFGENLVVGGTIQEEEIISIFFSNIDISNSNILWTVKISSTKEDKIFLTDLRKYENLNEFYFCGWEETNRNNNSNGSQSYFGVLSSLGTIKSISRPSNITKFHQLGKTSQDNNIFLLGWTNIPELGNDTELTLTKIENVSNSVLWTKTIFQNSFFLGNESSEFMNTRYTIFPISEGIIFLGSNISSSFPDSMAQTQLMYISTQNGSIFWTGQFQDFISNDIFVKEEENIVYISGYFEELMILVKINLTNGEVIESSSFNNLHSGKYIFLAESEENMFIFGESFDDNPNIFISKILNNNNNELKGCGETNSIDKYQKLDPYETQFIFSQVDNNDNIITTNPSLLFLENKNIEDIEMSNVCFSCFEISNLDTDEVCSGFGECTDFDTCECNYNNFKGEECEIFLHPKFSHSFGKSVGDRGIRVFKVFLEYNLTSSNLTLKTENEIENDVFSTSTEYYSNNNNNNEIIRETKIVILGRTFLGVEHAVVVILDNSGYVEGVYEIGISRNFVFDVYSYFSNGDLLFAAGCLDCEYDGQYDCVVFHLGINYEISNFHYLSNTTNYNNNNNNNNNLEYTYSINPIVSLQWSKNYGSTYHDPPEVVFQRDDIVYVGGRSEHWGGHTNDNGLFFLLFNKDGFIRERYVYVPSLDITFSGIYVLPNFEVICSIDVHQVVIKLNPDLDTVMWKKEFSVGNDIMGFDEDISGEFVLFIGNNAADDYCYFGKINIDDGDLIWARVISESGKIYYCGNEIKRIGNTNNFIVVGYTDRFSAEQCGFMFIFSSENGEIILSYIFENEIEIGGVVEEEDGRILLTGRNGRNEGRADDISLIRINLNVNPDSDDLIGCEFTEKTEFVKDDVSVLSLGTYGSNTWSFSSILFDERENDYLGFTLLKEIVTDWENHYDFCDCYGISIDSENVCNYQNGTCNSLDSKCYCNAHYHGKECSINECDNVFSNYTSSVCTGNGDCINYNNCSCDDEFYVLPFCTNLTFCNGIYFLNDSVCSSRGDCIGEHNKPETWKCDCWFGFQGENCEDFNCYGIQKNDSDVCSGQRGECVRRNKCDCFFGYFGAQCEVSECDGILGNMSSVCTGHGACIEYNKCDCITEEYVGDYCQHWRCFNISSFEKETVCEGHGDCVKQDTCFCHNGYGSLEYGLTCDQWDCGEYSRFDETVCTERGICVGSHECECKDNYHGNLCETWSCGTEYIFTESTCSGNGECVKPNDCECDFGFTGDMCEKNMMYYSIMTPTLSVFTISLIIIGISIFSYLLCCVVFSQKLKMKKFGKLRNIDIILQEQALEDDNSTAHIKINKILFEVDYDEITIEGILGEGGSSSVVYLAKWKGSKVAFKCFKTRHLCASQNSFDEFEREVEIMSSINHPNIVQFIGATLNPPRVGILMEFCNNGEIIEYYRKYRDNNNNDNDKFYPILDKLRMMLEITGSFDYLHSREIIHRDLKSENVLLDSKESCKLMDFGLSRIVDRMSQAKTTRIGTAVYMAPEIINDANYNEKCDVYSFAILMYIMITVNENPYEEEFGNSYGVEMKVSSNENFRPSLDSLRVKLEEQVSESDYFHQKIEKDEFIQWFCNIVSTCWNHDPKKRFSMNDLSKKFSKKLEEIKDYEVIVEEESKNGNNNLKNVFSKEEETIKEEEDEDSSDINMKENEELKKLRKELEEKNEKIEFLELENKELKNRLK